MQKGVYGVFKLLNISYKKFMAKRKKKGINLITIIIIICIIIIAGIFIKNLIQKNNSEKQTNTEINQIEEEKEKYVQILEDGTKLNISSKLKENKKLDNLELKDIQLTYKNGVTNLLCNIENTSEAKTDIQNVEIILLDEEGNTIYKMQGVIDPIDVGETKQFNSSITADFANAYNFEIVVK